MKKNKKEFDLLLEILDITEEEFKEWDKEYKELHGTSINISESLKTVQLIQEVEDSIEEMEKTFGPDIPIDVTLNFHFEEENNKIN